LLRITYVIIRNPNKLNGRRTVQGWTDRHYASSVVVPAKLVTLGWIVALINGRELKNNGSAR
jgi:hypothetical protein